MSSDDFRLGRFGSLWKLLALVEKLVHRNVQRASHLFQRFDGRDRMAILNAGDVAAKQFLPLLDYSLGRVAFLLQRSQPIRNDLGGRPPLCFFRRACNCLKYSGPRLAISFPPFRPSLTAAGSFFFRKNQKV